MRLLTSLYGMLQTIYMYCEVFKGATYTTDLLHIPLVLPTVQWIDTAKILCLAFFSVGEKLIVPIQPTSSLNLLPQPVEATLLVSVEVKGYVYI